MSKRAGIHVPGIHAPGTHAADAQQLSLAERLLRNCSSDSTNRRGFLRDSGLAAMSLALGAAIPFARFMPQGLIPIALAQSNEPLQLPGKDGLIVLSDRPINAETPPHLLDDEITPVNRFFVRNNGIPPELAGIDPDNWTLQLDGEACVAEKTLTLAELKSRFKHYTLQLQLECAGNGRSEFSPPTPGNQWGIGAVACAEWTGVRLRDVLEYCGVKDNAVYVAYQGADRHLSGDPGKQPISRGVPMRKAMEDESLIVWAMNGEPLPHLHGYPLRLMCGGWPASVCGKWLQRLMIRDRVHDGEKMTGQSYRMPCTPVAPGAAVADENMCIIESMPVRSLISYPKSGVTHSLAAPLTVRGHAWAGDNSVQAVHTSMDFGRTWQEASLRAPVNRLAWQHWSTELSFDVPGYYEIWARAVDSEGHSQPMVLPGWNPHGYLNNACHRIAVLLTA